MVVKKRTHILQEHWNGETVSMNVNTKWLLRVVLTLLLIKQLLVYIFLIVKGRIDFAMFTYWSYTILTGYYVLMWLALWIERSLLTFVSMFLFPIPLGTTFLVSLAIVIVIQQNAEVFTAAAGDGGQAALSLIHTGDWVLHNLPLIEILILLGLGWLLYIRSVIPMELSAIRSSEWRAAYMLYILIVPLVPLGIYSVIFDIEKHYPTGIPTYILWFGLVLFDLLWMGTWYMAFTVSARVPILFGTFAPWFNTKIAPVPATTTTEAFAPSSYHNPPYTGSQTASFNNMSERSVVLRTDVEL